MRAWCLPTILISCFLAHAAHAVGADSRVGTGHKGKPIDHVSFLVGEWKSVRNSGKPGIPPTTVVEKWSSAGNTLINVGYTVNGDSLVDYETVIIRTHGHRLAYEAHPMGQTPATFMSETMDASSIVFQNFNHDFPQRVGYRLVAQDSLLAWIEGFGKDTKLKRIEFPYRRVK